MTAPALELFEDVEDIASAADTKPLGSDEHAVNGEHPIPLPTADACPYPEVNALGERRVEFGVTGGRAWAQYAPVLAFRNCVLCDQLITKDENTRTVVFPDGVNPSWAHVECALRLQPKKDQRGMMGATEREIPNCARCSAAFEDHDVVDMGTRVCEDGERYESSPGVVGVPAVEWLRQVLHA